MSVDFLLKCPISLLRLAACSVSFIHTIFSPLFPFDVSFHRGQLAIISAEPKGNSVVHFV